MRGREVELEKKVREDFTITEKAPTRAFSWLKAPASLLHACQIFANHRLKLYREDPLRVQERAAAGEVAAPLEVGLPGPGAGHRLVPAHDPVHSARVANEISRKFLQYLEKAQLK